MESKTFNINVNVKAQSQCPLFGVLSTVVINQTRYFPEFTLTEKDGRLKTLGSFSVSSFYSRPYPQIFIKLESFKPYYVFQTLYGRLDDHVFSQKISNEIVVEVQRKMSQGFKQPLFIEVFVKLTPKVFNLPPSSSAPSTKESELEKTCAICLENMSGGSEDYFQMPNCSHWFHEDCIIEWIDRDNNSCPLCRQPLDEEGESDEESESEEETEIEGEV
ncbi:Brassinosteroid-responsive RING protein 1 [Cardamine amara subsp. amara]|uniref:Brassinosteroid-responsive RING protein 1 n=1 Tax=Cardamine amara subsp. amara TaxID=228776 RepID=A0ABD0ZHU4_CARAN